MPWRMIFAIQRTLKTGISARILGFGVWRSLVARLVRDEKVEGSNPFTPTSTLLHQTSILLVFYLIF